MQNRMPIGQVSKGMDGAMNSNIAAAYGALPSYVARGNFIQRPDSNGEPRKLAKMNPNERLPPPQTEGRPNGKSLASMNDNTMDTVDRLDSAKTFKRPGSRGQMEVKRLADLNQNPMYVLHHPGSTISSSG